MKLRIYVLNRPRFESNAFLSFLQDEQTSWERSAKATEAEEVVEIAGRVCYMSFGDRQSPRRNGDYLHNLIKQGHESVLEHVSWTFLATGVSRAFTHQLVRHRVGFSFSQLSQQYHEETEADFVEPAHLKESPEALAAWHKALDVSRDSYRIILNSLAKFEGKPGFELSKKEFNRAIRSAARSVLPNAIETKIVVTANARALRHFFDVRGSIPGDPEMRQVAVAIYNAVRLDAPSLFDDFAECCLADGTSALVRFEGKKSETAVNR